MNTPWGHSQGSTPGQDGIAFVSTPGHGGIRVSPEKLATMPEPFASFTPWAGAGWYEEDCDWAIVVLAFPEAFADPSRFGYTCTAERLRERAEEMLRTYNPDLWEAWQGRALKPGESRKRDEQRFYEKHDGDWITTSASGPCSWNDCPEGFVIVTAGIIGGDGSSDTVRKFLVPTVDYRAAQEASPFGVVIDPEQYAAA